MRIYLTAKHCISISEGNKKMGRVPSFSLVPGISCPIGVPCYMVCYARRMMLRRDNTALAYQNNLKAVQECRRKKIVEAIVNFIKWKKPKYFRFNVSGDFNVPGYWDLAMDVAKQCPETKFMAFTKCYKLQNRKRPDNFNLILSAWQEYNPGKNPKCGVAHYDDGTYPIPEDAIPCDLKCDQCFRCYDLKKGQSVVFKNH